MQDQYSLKEWVKAAKAKEYDYATMWPYTVQQFLAGQSKILGWQEKDAATVLDGCQSLAYNFWIEWWREEGPPPGTLQTPLSIAATMAEMLTGHTYGPVLDPCCGCGNLLYAAEKEGFECYGYEIDHVAATVAEICGHEVYEVGLDDKWKGQPQGYILHAPYVSIDGTGVPRSLFLAFHRKVLATGRPVVTLVPFGWWDSVGARIPESVDRGYVVVQRGLGVGGITLCHDLSAELLLLVATKGIS